MAMPTIYRRVNPQWLHYWALAHSPLCPSGIFTANFVSPIPYGDSQELRC